VVPLDSAVNIDFPAIVARFGLPIPMIQWIVISYVLTQTGLMLSFGRIGDMLGYRRVFLWGTGVSTLAFIGCALSPTYGALIAARMVQGIGAGLILACGPALATSLFPEAMRTQVLARYMMMFGVGSALGPSVFGWLENLGPVEEKEMFRVFNMGIGFVAIVSRYYADSIQRQLDEARVKTWVIGEVREGEPGVEFV